MDDSNENYVKMEATVEYLFIEYREMQEKPINSDQAWICGFINIFRNSEDFNDDIADFKKMLVEEFGYIVLTYDYFTRKTFSLEQYKFILVEEGKITREFQQSNEEFYDALRSSSHNLMIVGKNFDAQAFTQHRIFRGWVEEYCNP
ncbi:MAG: hypothetical protein RBG13Loki_1587 [Promethearchaeota archaeon CR_4]|nr:MAG: hypothetical protein RBG13Loki_1587 [Candidatus Lokiarchaeota archaeon CR_4]